MSDIVKDAKTLLEGRQFSYTVCYYHRGAVTGEKVVIPGLSEEDARERILRLNKDIHIVYIERTDD